MGRKKNTTMANKIYSKQDAVMIRGLAILCMVVLHLFCRTGKDVFGKPLLWINSTIGMLPSYRTMKYKSPIWGYFHVQKE